MRAETRVGASTEGETTTTWPTRRLSNSSARVWLITASNIGPCVPLRTAVPAIPPSRKLTCCSMSE